MPLIHSGAQFKSSRRPESNRKISVIVVAGSIDFRSSLVKIEVMAAEDVVGQLEEEAKRRRERLRALKQKLEGTEEDESNDKKIDKPLPKPLFRSYKPTDESLKEASVGSAKPIDIESHVEDTIKQGEVKTLLEDVDLTNLAPRKPDWDLKRDIAPKLLKLEKRTQKAIAELIFERLKKTQDLAGAVQAQQNPNAFDE